jgi:hypothetical protein
MNYYYLSLTNDLFSHAIMKIMIEKVVFYVCCLYFLSLSYGFSNIGFLSKRWGNRGQLKSRNFHRSIVLNDLTIPNQFPLPISQNSAPKPNPLITFMHDLNRIDQESYNLASSSNLKSPQTIEVGQLRLLLGLRDSLERTILATSANHQKNSDLSLYACIRMLKALKAIYKTSRIDEVNDISNWKYRNYEDYLVHDVTAIKPSQNTEESKMRIVANLYHLLKPNSSALKIFPEAPTWVNSQCSHRSYQRPLLSIPFYQQFALFAVTIGSFSSFFLHRSFVYEFHSDYHSVHFLLNYMEILADHYVKLKTAPETFQRTPLHHTIRLIYELFLYRASK